MPDSYYYRTAKVGKTVKFPCHTKLPEDVDWERLATSQSKRRYIYLGIQGPRDLGLNPRFIKLDKSHSHSLVIYNVTINDSAYYRCVEDAGLGNEHYYGLTVEGRPELFYVCIRRRRSVIGKQIIIIAIHKSLVSHSVLLSRIYLIYFVIC